MCTPFLDETNFAGRILHRRELRHAWSVHHGETGKVWGGQRIGMIKIKRRNLPRGNLGGRKQVTPAQFVALRKEEMRRSKRDE